MLVQTWFPVHFPTSRREEELTEKGETVSKKKIVVINLSEKLIIALKEGWWEDKMSLQTAYLMGFISTRWFNCHFPKDYIICTDSICTESWKVDDLILYVAYVIMWPAFICQLMMMHWKNILQLHEYLELLLTQIYQIREIPEKAWARSYCIRLS